LEEHFKEKIMVVENFSLTELLLTRQWLIMVEGSWNGTGRTPCGMSKDQAAQVHTRIQEVDVELTRRIIDGVKSNVINFVDPDFTETVKEKFGRSIESEDPDAGA
jgi:hypothetical protein